MSQCQICGAVLSGSRGLSIHMGKMHHSNAKPPEISAPPSTSATTSNVLNDATIPTNRPTPNLPPYTKASITPQSNINNLSGVAFEIQLSHAYNTIIKWRPNLFKLPTGRAAKEFLSELTLWLQHFNNKTEFQGISLKVYHTLPALLLQKPSGRSKAKEHLKKLEERLEKWKAGDIEGLLKEGDTIQQHLASRKPRPPEDTAKIFAKLMLQGKISAALNLLSNGSGGGVLPLSQEVLDELTAKHPSPAPILEGSLLRGPVQATPQNYFDPIDEQMIHKAAQQTKGAGGPSHCDANQYQRFLLSNKHKVEGKHLREEIALLARYIASHIIDPVLLEAFTSCRLIPLDKCPGVRPIGVGEVLRRIIGKAIGWVLKDDITESAGPLQASGGLKGGAEAAIHSMRTIFNNTNTEAVILVDASNAFNALNRQVALHNVQITCPHFATILINTYRYSSRLAIAGGKEIKSTEGSTQGDNLGGHLYNQGMITLQTLLLITTPEVSQVWLADDATGAGTLNDLHTWWSNIVKEGSKFGYFVNKGKSWLILKNQNQQQSAQELFSDTNINITVKHHSKRHHREPVVPN